MRKAFTLVELLIVVLVFVTLMSIVFRLSSIGSDSEARSRTIMTLQKVENCLSGYYAAFGSYPPVKVHGKRSYLYKVDTRGIQQLDEIEEGVLCWKRVKSACMSQPVAMNYPYAENMLGYVDVVADQLMELHKLFPDSRIGKNQVLAKGGFDGLKRLSSLNEKAGSSEWSDIQLFRFGLMSFLLPRYLIMMGRGLGESGTSISSDVDVFDNFAQWSENNEKPCRFEDGVPYQEWRDLAADLANPQERWKIQLIPSQAVTARWMPNLAGLLVCDSPNVVFFGVNVAAVENSNLMVHEDADPVFFDAGDSQSGSDSNPVAPYVLDGITCRDGWGQDIYYYSPAPYQSYRLWSAGPNGKTFPPWVSQEEIKELNQVKDDQGNVVSGRDPEIEISNWISDDIVQMSN